MEMVFVAFCVIGVVAALALCVTAIRTFGPPEKGEAGRLVIAEDEDGTYIFLELAVPFKELRDGAQIILTVSDRRGSARK